MDHPAALEKALAEVVSSSVTDTPSGQLLVHRQALGNGQQHVVALVPQGEVMVW